MKKLASLLLALSLTLALAIPAFAEGNVLGKDEVSGDTSQNVTATVSVTEDETKNTYYATIEWGTAPTFTYNFKGTTYTWNTTDLKYDTASKGSEGWKTGDTYGTSATADMSLKVINRSDKKVYCKAVMTKAADQNELNIGFWEAAGSTTAEKKEEAAAAVTIGDNQTAANYTTKGSGKETTADLSGKIVVSGKPTKTAADSSNPATLATITVTLSKVAFT